MKLRKIPRLLRETGALAALIAGAVFDADMALARVEIPHEIPYTGLHRRPGQPRKTV